ncbi:MAG: hypothetical protein EZS28_014072 [Streblomastix strix]|uniref:Uncharacterized protein n=1 Tax=Streblomastix strix TaxID=222440 RepID=A0A5J4W7F5_9EUKA|nr:MAG: hypothetical protein EZS28_014072 [Streblomastix strix]
MLLPIGVQYYVGTTGDDQKSCSQSEPCKTLDATALLSNANTSAEYIVYVMDKTTLSSVLNISSEQSLPRTFTNNPEISSTQSEIEINIGGQFNISCNSLFERINFAMQDGVSNSYGGVVNAYFPSSSGKIDINRCNFIRCKSTNRGGALYIQINNIGESTLRNLTFNQCEALNIGGALYAHVESGGKLKIAGSCSFTDCRTLSGTGYGGGLHASINGENSSLTFEDSMTFDGCLGNYGGGMDLEVFWFSKLIMTGSCLFKDCNCSNAGGGCYIIAFEPNYNINLLGNIQCEGCYCDEYAGGLCIIGQQIGQITINDMSFSGCNSSIQGGGFYSYTYSGAQMTIIGKITFDNCNCLEGQRGGQYLSTNDPETKINITGELEYKQCSASSGGGLYSNIRNNAVFEINRASFKLCFSSQRGGGICTVIQSGGQEILNKSCEFYQCESNGNGGGIYVRIYDLSQCKINIKDASIHECRALNSTNTSLSYSQSGFGGGLFLGGDGYYDPTSERIDLHGMKINNNTADNFGQSLYVVMTKIVDFCQYRIQGEYVKGNYSDIYSNETDIEGIPMDLTTFNSRTQDQIIEKQQPLELWWSLGILKSAQVIVNISNPNGKLIFHLEGQSMIPNYLNVKIFEMRNKTKEEIDKEQKEMNYKYNKNILKSLKRTSSQSPISQKHQKADQQQISINTTPQIKKKIHNYENEIIYPPEDGSSIPIQIEGEIQIEQKATFGMNEYKWLNYQQKVYGVLISNDRNIFTGKDGHDIEEDANAAVQLEVNIEEEKRKGLKVGVIVGIAVGALAIVAVIIIIIIVAVVISKKNKAKKTKNPVEQYGPEMRARNLPMENKYPQNSHSLDAVNKAMESNNW